MHVIRDALSPSQLTLAHNCLRAWVLKYLHGTRTPFQQTLAKMLGVLIHACLEHYAKTGSVYADLEPLRLQRKRDFSTATDEQWTTMCATAPDRALAAVGYLPAFGSAPMYSEIRFALQGDLIWSDMCSMDLVTLEESTPLLADYKSTGGRGNDPWAYVPTLDDLRKDAQYVLYSAYLMQLTQRGQIKTRWIYVDTNVERQPQAIAIPDAPTWEAIQPWLTYWVGLARYLRGLILDAQVNGPPPWQSIKPPDLQWPDYKSQCKAYGGCAFHRSKGGPCDVGYSVASLLRS